MFWKLNLNDGEKVTGRKWFENKQSKIEFLEFRFFQTK